MRHYKEVPRPDAFKPIVIDDLINLKATYNEMMCRGEDIADLHDKLAKEVAVVERANDIMDHRKLKILWSSLSTARDALGVAQEWVESAVETMQSMPEVKKSLGK